jgi:hypothetical protein
MKAAAPGLDIRSPTRIKFPDLCARCGTPTRKTIPVKIISGDPKDNTEATFNFPLSHISGPLMELRSGSTKIPCCPACRRPYVIGYVLTLASAAAFALISYYQPGRNDPSNTYLVIQFSVIFILFLGFVLSYPIGQEKAAPVRIWQGRNGYRYHFFSGACHDWAKSQDVQPSGAPE